MTDLKEIKPNINIKNIRSPYIQKKVFSFINKNQLLNIIIYNKKLQHLLYIDIGDYKKNCVRYKIGERNGKGKEYYKLNTNHLIFEGEYKNGKRNGIGKEFDRNGKLEFEGKYLNGKRNGRGVEYIDNTNNMDFISKKMTEKKKYLILVIKMIIVIIKFILIEIII